MLSGANYCTGGYTTATEVPAAAAAQPRNPMSACQNQTVLPASPPAAARLPQVLLGCRPPCQACGSANSNTQLLSASRGVMRRAPGVCICQCQGKVSGKLCGVAQAGAELYNMEGGDMDNACHPLSTMHCVMVCY